MVALRLFTLLLLAASIALPARADVFPYEAAGIQGRNNLVDSNAQSCDQTEGCFTRTGARCSANPGTRCDLQIVPAGRCTYGELLTGLICVFPHGAGHCASDVKVGCLTDAYQLNNANTASGPSAMCSSLATNTCSMTTDPYGGAFQATACTCQGTNSAAVGTFETAICRGAQPVCSDGDPLRDLGGYGTALGTDINLGTNSFAALGPSTIGAQSPISTPYYTAENPPSDFDAQRDAGTVGRTNAGPIHQVHTTDARNISDFGFGIKKIESFGNSYWNDWVFNTPRPPTPGSHIVVFPCDPPTGWSTDIIVPATGSAGTGGYCSAVGRNTQSFVWSRDLTAGELSANPNCPPNCKKDYDISTTELAAFVAAGRIDPDAGTQLAIQSGQGRQAGAGDSIGVAAVTSMTWLRDTDYRCKMGGWDNVPNSPVADVGPNPIGRCNDGPQPCTPGVSTCAGQGGSCRACNGPLPPVVGADPLGLPIGYNTQGRPELDLVAGKRIGGLAGETADIQVRLFVVATSGYAASDFRDKSQENGNIFDTALEGQVTNASVWGPGVGTGGTFTNGTTLPIGEACCDGGANIVWGPAQLGTPATPGGFPAGDFSRTYDVGPGPDGIPGCIGDNSTAASGSNACNERLGDPAVVVDPLTASTGLDDVLISYDLDAAGPGGLIPASAPRFQARDADAATVSYFTTNYGTTSNPPTTNSVAAFTDRDIQVFIAGNTDILVKVNTSECPLTTSGAACSTGVVAPDGDGDGVPDATDNCPTVANANQADGDLDLVGDACDNCVATANPRVVATFLTTNTWATLTGGQRDDDHDGFGNVCDGDFPGTGAIVNVNAADTAQFKSALGKSRIGDTCGTIGTRPCAIYDLNLNQNTDNIANINAADTARFKTFLGFPAGPKCAACTGTGSIPLPCTAGATGNCN
jgi:hypothetical protein